VKDIRDRVPSQLPLPLSLEPGLSREDFVVGAANAEAVALIDAWPDWPVGQAALHGQTGCGKTHLVSIWRELSGARVRHASQLSPDDARGSGPLAIEDVDLAQASPGRDAALFAALEFGAAPVLLTGRSPPAGWPWVLPDLASRFAGLTSLQLGMPDEALLADIARKLFADRQLLVPDAAIAQMLRLLERSPRAIREFIATVDAVAFAEGRPVNLSLVRALLAAREGGLR
jgi:chromosomal replication initiation ATPase DnaA